MVAIVTPFIKHCDRSVPTLWSARTIAPELRTRSICFILGESRSRLGALLVRYCKWSRSGPIHRLRNLYDPVRGNKFLKYLAPRPGLEPGTCGLTVRRSTS